MRRPTPRVLSQPSAPAREEAAAPAPALPTELRLKLLRLMLATRANDEVEQGGKRRGLGHFQLSTLGHEALVGVALAMQPEDWLHPHYRDRGLVLARGMTQEQLFLEYFGKRTAYSGGRQMPMHYCSRARRIVSMSSPVGTNFPQALGIAQSLRERRSPEVVVALLGDAGSREGEVMEALLEAAIERLPIVFIIEDNGYGISTPTTGKTFWGVARGLGRGEDGANWCLGCRVEVINGLDPEEVYGSTAAALARARTGQGPTCLVAKLERLCSHSSSDDHRLYRKEHELAELARRDPVVLYTERLLTERLVTPQQLEAWKTELRAEGEAAMSKAQAAPDPDPAGVRNCAFAPLPPDLPVREQRLPVPQAKAQGGLNMAQSMARVLEQELQRNERMCIFGEDIEDPKGDVFGITRGLSTAFPGRVKNSPLAETTILGTSIGRALMGDLAVATIQFVDFVAPAINQIFNEAATMYWRSKGEYNCPVVVMAPSGGYLPGCGPWHSQSGESLFAHQPGLHLVAPSNAADAAGLLRYALRCGRPVVFLYPKALLHSADDTVEEPDAECAVPFGQARVARPGRDVTVVTWGNGVPLCQRAAQRAAAEGLEAEILDLRSLVPWDVRAVLESVQRTGRLLVVHEDNKTCGLGGEIVAEVCQAGFDRLVAPPRRLTRSDDHIPYQFDLELALLPGAEGVLAAMRELVRSRRPEVPTAPAPLRAAVPAPALLRPAAPAAVPAAAPPSRRLAVVVPKQSPTDEEASVVRFHVQPGQAVKVGTLLAEMEANKGSFEVDCPHPGTVVELVAREGQRVRIGGTLLYLELPEEMPLEGLPGLGEPSAAPVVKEIRLSPAQLQVGALALKSRAEIPCVSVDMEVDLTALAPQREALQAEFERRWGLHVSYTHLLLWAMTQAMKESRNEGFRGRLDPSAERLLIGPHVNVAFAVVGRNEDLYSPVIKRSDQLTLRQLVQRAQELTAAVRTGSIGVGELQGASVTLTNIGPLQAAGGMPFVIPGQLAMLASGALTDLPRYVQAPGRPEPELQRRKILKLTLVFDHRPFNGTHAVGFLDSIKRQLEPMDLEAHLRKG